MGIYLKSNRMSMLTVQSRMLKQQVRLTAVEISEEAERIHAAKLDVQAFKPLYEKYFSPILGFVYKRVEDKDQALDITSQVFEEALNSLSRYEHKGLPFSAWLYRIALNLLGKHYRSGKVRRTVSLDDSGIVVVQDDLGNSARTDSHLFAALQRLKEEEMQLVAIPHF